MKTSRAESRNAQLVRLLRVLRELDVLGGVSLEELAQRHGTTTRTIRRDFEALEQAGVPLVEGEEKEGKRKRWRLAFKDAWAGSLSQLVDESHFLALRMAMGEGRAARNASGIFASLEDLAQKVEKAAGPAARARLAAIDASFLSYERFAYRRAAPEVFWPLVDAITEGRLCRVTYRAPRTNPVDVTFEILPLKLLAHEGAPYVLCQHVRHGTILTLNLQRARRLVPLQKKGKPPADFDAARWEAAAFGIFSGGKPTTYRLRFAAGVAPYIRERTWHPTQTLKELKGGGVELEFTCGESVEVTAWVASWRDWVVAVAPGSLRGELRELGSWMVGEYGRRSAQRRRSKLPVGRA